MCEAEKGICGMNITIVTYQRDPAKLEPGTALGLNNLGIVATRADVRRTVTLLLNLVGAAKHNRDTEEKVLKGEPAHKRR